MMSADTNDRLIPDAIYTFSDGWNQAQVLAKKCCAHLGMCDTHRFPDGETLVTIRPPETLGGRVVALYRSLQDPNTKLVETMLAANALRGLGAAKLILIAPYLPYMRQDRAFAPGQAVSQSAIGKFLAAHFDALVTVQPHLHRTSSLSEVFGGKPAIPLSAGHAIAAHAKESVTPFTVIAGPDEESGPLIRDVVDRLRVTWFVARKCRYSDSNVAIELPPDMEIQGKPVVIVDDIISSGGTVATLAKGLKQAGAADITVYAVHALFDQRAAFVMERAGVTAIRSLSTVPHPSNAIAIVDILCAGLGVPQ